MSWGSELIAVNGLTLRNCSTRHMVIDSISSVRRRLDNTALNILIFKLRTLENKKVGHTLTKIQKMGAL